MVRDGQTAILTADGIERSCGSVKKIKRVPVVGLREVFQGKECGESGQSGRISRLSAGAATM